MLRYYLHLRRGREVVLDRIGVQFHDQVTVELEAMRAAAKVGTVSAKRNPARPERRTGIPTNRVGRMPSTQA